MRTFTLSVIIASGLAALVASPDTARADTVPFANLPVAPPMTKATTPPTPEKIAASEHTEGIYPAILPEAKRKSTDQEGYRYVQVFGTDREAQAYAADGTLTTNNTHQPSAARTCLTSGGTLSPHLSLYYRTKPYVAPKPSAATIEILKKQHRWPPPAQ